MKRSGKGGWWREQQALSEPKILEGNTQMADSQPRTNVKMCSGAVRVVSGKLQY